MNTSTNRTEQALEACDKVINGIEDGTLTALSSLLLCKKIARLVNDCEGKEWLEYEYGGYLREENGHLKPEVGIIAAKHGRMYRKLEDDGKWHSYLFLELCGELETCIESNKKAISNFSTQGFSVSGEKALIATERMNSKVKENTDDLLDAIKKAEQQLSKLKSQYYDYACKWQIELQFGKVSKSIFEEYQDKVDSYFASMKTTIVQKLNAIQELVEDENLEHYAQVLTTCRRLWSEVAKSLFEEIFPNYSQKKFKTKAGKEIDVSGDHDNNKLSAIIETMQGKVTKNTIVGSETLYLIDWMEMINNRQSTGVHSEVTKEQALQCIIHTYIALGDILALKCDYDKQQLL